MSDDRVVINGYSFPAGTVIPPEVKTAARMGISADAARTLRAQIAIQTGRHPLNGKPLREPRGKTCGSCAHCVDSGARSHKTFWKCAIDRPNWTRGPGSDLRKKWPACASWAERPDPGNAPALGLQADPGNAPELGGRP